MCSDPSISRAVVPEVHTGGGWSDPTTRDAHDADILSGMLLEAMRRGNEKAAFCKDLALPMNAVMAEIHATALHAQVHVSSVVQDGGRLRVL